MKASLKWYQKSGEDWTEISAAPTDAGEYSVKAYAEESDDYEAGYSKRVEFTISKAQNEWTVNPAINSLLTFVVLAVAPFNILKGLIVGVITFLLYKHVSPILHGTQF